MRQCRYYAPASFFALLGVLQYLRVLGDRPRAHWWMAVAAVGLFHSFYVLCAAILIATALHFAIFERDVDRLKALLPTFASRGFEVVSSTPRSRANAFISYVPLEQAVAEALVGKPVQSDTSTLIHSSELKNLAEKQAEEAKQPTPAPAQAGV